MMRHKPSAAYVHVRLLWAQDVQAGDPRLRSCGPKSKDAMILNQCHVKQRAWKETNTSFVHYQYSVRPQAVYGVDSVQRRKIASGF